MRRKSCWSTSETPHVASNGLERPAIKKSDNTALKRDPDQSRHDKRYRNRKEKIAFVKRAPEMESRNTKIESKEREKGSRTENVLNQISRVSPNGYDLPMGHVDDAH